MEEARILFWLILVCLPYLAVNIFGRRFLFWQARRKGYKHAKEIEERIKQRAVSYRQRKSL